jgi:CRP-like cAMP-binding protein
MVASFLLEMAERPSGAAEPRIVRQMSRYDIADVLALSVETVSRTLTDLKRHRAIRLNTRHRVAVIDRDTLGGVSENIRQRDTRLMHGRG